MDLRTETKEQIENSHKLFWTIAERAMKENIPSQSTMENILIPCQQLDNEIGDKYTKELIRIVETSETDAEILTRAYEYLKQVK